MNKFIYYIKTHFIPSNKYYNSYRTLHLVYQTYPKSCKSPRSQDPYRPSRL